MANVQVRDRFAAHFAGIQFFEVCAHLAQHGDNAGAGRIEADVLDHEIAAGHDRGGHREEGRAGGIARYHDIAGAHFGRAVDAHDAFAILLADFELGAEAGQHPFGMVAGGDGFDHRGDAGRIETRQKDRALHLRAGNGQPVSDGYGRFQPFDQQGEGATRRRFETRAHLAQGIDHPAHGALRQAGIARQHGGNSLAGDKAQQQAGGGARIAHLQRASGLQETAHTHAVDDPVVLFAADRGAHRGQRGSGRQHVLAFQQARNPAAAHGKRREHERTVADGLVARNADAPLQRSLRGEATGLRWAGRMRAGHAARVFDRGTPFWQGARRC